MDKKKIISIVAVVIIGIVLYFVGSKFYMNNMYNYKKDVKQSLDSYYSSLSVNDLEPIPELFKKYSSNELIKNDIQSYSKDLVVEWVDFINNKYVCDLKNLNSCKLQLNELSDLAPQIDKLYNYRDIDGYRILNYTSYKIIKDNLSEDISKIQQIIADDNAKRPSNEVELREEKCNATNDCDDCRNGICSCVYSKSGGVRENIICKKNISS